MKDKTFRYVCSERQLSDSLRWRDWSLEDCSYGLGYWDNNGSESQVRVREIIMPTDDEIVRSAYAVDPTPEFLCKLFNRAAEINANAILQNHTHPFTRTRPAFSGIDDSSARGLYEDFSKVTRNPIVVQYVYGLDNCERESRYLSDDGRFHYFEPLQIVGPSGFNPLPGKHDHDSDEIAPTEMENRTVAAFGETCVRRAHVLRVLIAGMGGLGSQLLQFLQRIGVKHLAFLDDQEIENTNQPRLVYVTDRGSSVGKPKVEMAADYARRYDPSGDYRPMKCSVFDTLAVKEAVQWADLVVVALDRDAPRDELSVLCNRHFRPLINVANAIYVKDQNKIAAAYASTQWQFPGEPEYPCLRCHGGLDMEEIDRDRTSDKLKQMRQAAGYVSDTDYSPKAQVIPINSIAAGLATWQIAMWVGGLQRPAPWVHFDVMNHDYQKMNPVQNHSCSVCSTHPASSFAVGDVEPVPLEDKPLSGPAAISTEVRKNLFLRLLSKFNFRRGFSATA